MAKAQMIMHRSILKFSKIVIAYSDKVFRINDKASVR